LSLGDASAAAGGLAPGRALQAVLLGGAAGTFVGPDALDMPLSFEGARAAGATLGSGVVMVFDDTADLHDTLARIAEFFRHESCGQCVPCRVGTVRQQEHLSGAGSRHRIRSCWPNWDRPCVTRRSAALGKRRHRRSRPRSPTCRR
jgi:NADH:ubiquinone oxidoreductase subunit F (NADH-binding)